MCKNIDVWYKETFLVFDSSNYSFGHLTLFCLKKRVLLPHNIIAVSSHHQYAPILSIAGSMQKDFRPSLVTLPDMKHNSELT